MIKPNDTNASRHQVFLFPSRETAEPVIHELVRLGVPREKISLLQRSALEADKDSHAIDNAIETGGVTGAGLGATAGGLGGLLAGLGVLVIPGIGALAALGPIAAALTGAVTGTAVGGFAGALIGVGVSEAEAAAAERHLKLGGTLVLAEHDREPDLLTGIVRAGGGDVPDDR